MDYKHSCVIDAQNLYKTFVLVLLAENEEGQQEEKIQYYTLQDGEQLVDTAPPVMRPYAGNNKADFFADCYMFYISNQQNPDAMQVLAASCPETYQVLQSLPT